MDDLLSPGQHPLFPGPGPLDMKLVRLRAFSMPRLSPFSLGFLT
jgi:hypothetical protein